MQWYRLRNLQGALSKAQKACRDEKIAERESALIITHISQHAKLEIPMNLRDPSEFSPPRPASAASGRGGRGVRGRALTCMTPVQLFVCDSETQLEIEFTIKKPIKTQCKTPHPQPLSPSTGEYRARGARSKDVDAASRCDCRTRPSTPGHSCRERLVVNVIEGKSCHP